MTRYRVKQLIAVFCLGFITLTFAQDNQLSYLSQKLALENSVKERVTTALEKLLDDVKFVVDVKAEIEFTPIEQTRTIIGAPQTVAEPSKTITASTTASSATESQATGSTPKTNRPASELSLPLPGFEVPPSIVQPQENAPAQTQLNAPPQTKPAETSVPQPAQTAAPNVSTSIQKTTIPVPIVKRQEINVILEDGVSPELIENVRQIVAVASHYDRVRGDIISIMTANFKKTPGKDPTETIILKNIAEKIDDIEKRQSQTEYNARLEDQKRLERQAIVRDSLKVDELKRQIAELQAQLQAPQTTEAQRQITAEQTSARETELANLRDQLKESNRRLQELELSSLETTPPSMFGIRNTGMWYVIIIAAVLLLALLILLLANHRKQVKRQELEWGYGSKIPMGPRPPQPVLSRQPEENKIPAVPTKTTAQPIAAPTPAPTVQPAGPVAPPVDLEAQREEMKSMRQSVISMTVGQPDTASRIINSWLSQEIQPNQSESES